MYIVNLIFPEGCVRTLHNLPPLPPVSRGSTTAPKIVDTFKDSNASDTDIEHQIALKGVDDETFNLLMISMKREIFDVEHKIKSFGEDDVCLALKDEILLV